LFIFDTRRPKTEVSDDHEEEFYYTEVEIPDLSPTLSSSYGGSSIMGLGMAFSPTLSHMDMVRPPSEGTPWTGIEAERRCYPARPVRIPYDFSKCNWNSCWGEVADGLVGFIS